MSSYSSESDEVDSLWERLRRAPDAPAASLAERLLASRDDPGAHKRLWGLVCDLLNVYQQKDDLGEKDDKAISAVRVLLCRSDDGRSGGASMLVAFRVQLTNCNGRI